MGVVKRIVPNAMWFITRRVMWREWRLRPSKKLNKIFGFVVFKVAAELGIKISALCVMSNHWHAVVSASKRNLPLFMQKVHSELARAINAAHGDVGRLWDDSDDNYRLLETDEDVVRAISYTMNNPVAPGGVRHGKSWPGIRVAWPAKEKTLERAKPFYRTEEAGGETPPYVTRMLSRPLRFEGVGDGELAQRIARACQEGEDKRAAEVLAAGGTFRRRADIRRLSAISGRPRANVASRPSDASSTSTRSGEEQDSNESTHMMQPTLRPLQPGALATEALSFPTGPTRWSSFTGPTWHRRRREAVHRPCRRPAGRRASLRPDPRTSPAPRELERPSDEISRLGGGSSTTQSAHGVGYPNYSRFGCILFGCILLVSGGPHLQFG